jgi:hypothetical protein
MAPFIGETEYTTMVADGGSVTLFGIVMVNSPGKPISAALVVTTPSTNRFSKVPHTISGLAPEVSPHTA